MRQEDAHGAGAMLEGAASELVDAVSEQAALVERAHLAALVCVARGLKNRGYDEVQDHRNSMIAAT